MDSARSTLPAGCRPLAVVGAWLALSLCWRLSVEIGTAMVITMGFVLQGRPLESLRDPQAVLAELSPALLGAASIVQLLGLGALAVGAARALGPDLRRAFAVTRPGAAALAVAAFGGLCVGFFPGWVAQTLSERLPWLDFGNLALLDQMLAGADLGGKVVMLLAIAVCAPIVEELVFRGFLWSALERALPRWGVWLATSALFAAYHVDPLHVIAVFFTGLFLGWIRWATGSIVPCIAAHFANNALAAVVVLFVPVAEDASNPGWAAALSVGATAVLSVALWVLGHDTRAAERAEEPAGHV